MPLVAESLQSELNNLRALAGRLTSTSADADDLVQDTFMKALRHAAKYSEAKGDVGVWLRSIMRNDAKNAVRDRGRFLRVVGSEDLADAAMLRQQQDGNPEVAATRSEEAARIRAAIDMLPEAQAAAVRLCDLEGLAYAEIAATMGWPIGTVMSRIHRGRRALETILAGAQ